jgi:hypothetical protein
MWEDSGAYRRLEIRKAVQDERSTGVSEDKKMPDPEVQQQDEGEDVEAHGFKPGVKPAAEPAATEEGPDVEAHGFKPGVKPEA